MSTRSRGAFSCLDRDAAIDELEAPDNVLGRINVIPWLVRLTHTERSAAASEYDGALVRSPQRTMPSRRWMIGWALLFAAMGCGAGTVKPCEKSACAEGTAAADASTGPDASAAVARDLREATTAMVTTDDAASSMPTRESSEKSAAPNASSAPAAAPRSSTAFARRCGWVDNPTPQNWWITDRDGEWEISAQGRRQADGDLPDFDGSEWVRTNGYHGYGCACLEVRIDLPSRAILEIRGATVLPLERCRADRALPRR